MIELLDVKFGDWREEGSFQIGLESPTPNKGHLCLP